MKKTVLAVLTIAIVLLVGATTVFAAGSKGACRFVDADRNGICDHYAECKEQKFGDGYGIKHTNGFGHGHGNGRCGR